MEVPQSSDGWLESSPMSGIPASASASPTVAAEERICKDWPSTVTVSARDGTYFTVIGPVMEVWIGGLIWSFE